MSCDRLLASEGFGAYDKIQKMVEEYPDFSWYKLKGHHHLHMDKQASKISKTIQDCLS